jgi:hypothetical protein
MPSTVENTDNIQEKVKSIISSHAKYIDECKSIDEYDYPIDLPEYNYLAGNTYKEILKEENKGLVSIDHQAYVLFILADYYKRNLTRLMKDPNIVNNYREFLTIYSSFEKTNDCRAELGYYGVILKDIFHGLPKTLPVKKELFERAFSCKRKFEIDNRGTNISKLNGEFLFKIFDSIHWVEDTISDFYKVEEEQKFDRAQDFINTFANEGLKPLFKSSLKTLKTTGTTEKEFQHANKIINNISKKYFAELFKRDYLKLINIIEKFNGHQAFADKELEQIPDLINKLETIYIPVVGTALKDQDDNVKTRAKIAFRPFLIISCIGKLYHEIYTIKNLHKAFHENNLNINTHIKEAFNQLVFLKGICANPELNIDNIFKIINIKNSGYILHLISEVCKNSESEELKGLFTQAKELSAQFKQLSGRDAEYYYHQIILSELLTRFKTANKEKPLEEAYNYAKSINDLTFATSIACKYADLLIKTQDYQKAATLLNSSFKLFFSSKDALLIDEKARLFLTSKKLYLSCTKDKNITEDKDRIKLLETLRANLIYQSLLFSDCLNKHQINKIALLETEGKKLKLLNIPEEEKENDKCLYSLTQEIEALTFSKDKQSAENSKQEKSDARFDNLLNECSNLIAEASNKPKSMTKAKIYTKALNSLKDAFKLAKTEEEQNAYEQERSNLLSALEGFKLPFTAPLISELEKLTFIKKEVPVVSATTPVVTKEEEEAVVNKTESSKIATNIAEESKPISSKPETDSTSKIKNIPQKEAKTTAEKPKKNQEDSISEVDNKTPVVTSEPSIVAKNSVEAPKPISSKPKKIKITQKKSERTIDVPKAVVDENDRIDLTHFQPFVKVKSRRDKLKDRKARQTEEKRKAEEALANKTMAETTRTTSTLTFKPNKAPEKATPPVVKPTESSKDIKEFNYTKTTKGISESKSKEQPIKTSQASETFWATKEEKSISNNNAKDSIQRQKDKPTKQNYVSKILVKNTKPPVMPAPVKQARTAVAQPVAKEMNPATAPYPVMQNMVPVMPYPVMVPDTSWVDYVQYDKGIKEYNEGVELFNKYKDTKEKGLLEATMQKLEEAIKYAEYYKRADYAAISALYLAQVYPYSQAEFPTVCNYILGAINATKKFLKSRFDHFGNISTDDLNTFSHINVLFNETIKYWEESINNETDVEVRNKQLLDLEALSVLFGKETDKCFKFAGKEKTYRELEKIRNNLEKSQKDLSL